MSAHYKHTTALQPPNAPMEKDHFSVNVNRDSRGMVKHAMVRLNIINIQSSFTA